MGSGSTSCFLSNVCLSLWSGTFEDFQVHGEWAYATFNGSQTNVLVNELSTGCIAWFNSCFYCILFILFDSSSQLIVIKVTNSWRLCGNSSVSLTLIFILSKLAFIQIRFAYSITKNIKYKNNGDMHFHLPFLPIGHKDYLHLDSFICRKALQLPAWNFLSNLTSQK